MHILFIQNVIKMYIFVVVDLVLIWVVILVFHIIINHLCKRIHSRRKLLTRKIMSNDVSVVDWNVCKNWNVFFIINLLWKIVDKFICFSLYLSFSLDVFHLNERTALTWIRVNRGQVIKQHILGRLMSQISSILFSSFIRVFNASDCMTIIAEN